LANDKVLKVDVNVTSKTFGDVLEKAKGGKLSDKERRDFFALLNNTLLQLKKTIDQLQKTIAQQQKAIPATAPAARGTGAQKEEQARQKSARAIDDHAEKVKKSGTWIQRNAEDAGREIKRSGKKAAKDIEDAGKEQAEATKKTTWRQREAAKETDKVATEAGKASKKLQETSKAIDDTTKEIKKAGEEAKNTAASWKKAVDDLKGLPDEIKKSLVQPYKTPRIDPRMAEIDKMMARFGNSLNKLLTTIEKEARATARRSRGRLEVLGQPGAGFTGTEREFKLEIADIDVLIKKIKEVSDRIGEAFEKPRGAKSEDLFKELRARVARELRLELPSYEKQAQEVAKIMSKEMGKVVKAAELMKDKTEQQLEELFDAKVIQAQFEKLRKDIVKTISVPRIQRTPEGNPIIEGRTGARKGVIRFAEFETGLDRLFNAIGKNFKTIADQQQKDVKEVAKEFKGLKLEIVKELTGPARATKLEDLYSELLKLATQAGKGPERLVRAGAARAIATAEARQAGGVTAPAFATRRRELEKLDINELRDKFVKLSKELDVSTRDIVKSLDRLSFQNFYDRILKSLKEEDDRGRSHLRRFFQSLEQGYTSALRDFERGISNVAALLPQAAPNLPKAGLAARETTAVIAQAPRTVQKGQYGEYVTERAQRLYQPEVAQREIIELNKKLKGYFDDLAVTGRLVDEEVKSLSTLGVSESVGAAIDQLGDLNKVLVKMSSLDLTRLGPFGEQFANAARQMSQTMRALTGPMAEFPRLRSRTEQKFIEQGSFGKQGYGYNVVTELRHTADTFEDQVEIGGKLAKAITETVRKVVVPKGAIPEELTAEKIDKVGNEIVKLLGERQNVKFSADETFLKELRQTTTVATGQDVDVYIATLVEKFFAEWGRKITTRGATKGVATFPLAQAAAGGAKIGLAEENLGTAKIPKTMGELASEVLDKALGKDAENELKQSLIEAGNKFFIDIFTGAESALGETEGKKLQNLLADLNKVLGTSFKATSKGVENFRKYYEESIGEAANLFKEVPIEARVSLRGVAKRGVQSEVLETFMNNLTGAVETVIPDAVDIEKFLGRGRKKGVFEKYLKALGYLQEEGEKVAAYTDVMEKGRGRRGLVGEKFLQVVEEPHLKAPWEEADVERGAKGLRVNLQAFAALSSIFGRTSKYMEEIADAERVSADEARELITAMSLLGSKFDDLKPSLAKLIDIVNIGDLKVFERASGTFEDMKDTILDFDKYAKAFVLSFPEAIGGGGLYVPGAAARKTYPEEFLGGVGPGDLARKLDLVVDAAQRALEIAGGYGKTAELLPAEEIVRGFGAVMDRYISRIQEEAKKPTPSEKAIKQAFGELVKFIQPLRKGKEIPNVPAIFTPYFARGKEKELPLTPTETVRRTLTSRLGVKGGLEELAGKRFKDIPRNARTIAEIYADIGRQIRDIVVGSETWSEDISVSTKLLERMREAGTEVFSPEMLEGLVPDPETFAKNLRERKASWKKFADDISDIGFLEENIKKQTERAVYVPRVQSLLQSQEDDAEKVLRDFANKTKVEVEKFSEVALERANQRLARARISYSEELAKQLLGKGKAIDVGLFQRQVPAARGQVINLRVDKIPELEKALTALEQLDAGTGRLSENINGLQTVIEEQKRLREEATTEGRPFLREGEVLIPPEKAKLLGDQVADALKKGAEVFVETVRFPITGAPSFQPARARLAPPELAAAAPTVIGLPGRAPIEPGLVENLLKPLQDQIESTRITLDGLDEAVAKGLISEADAADQRASLIPELERLKDIVAGTTTKFAPFEQNLDFDGDALFVHAAKTKEAADEIKKHYDSLRGMDKDIYAVRQAIFNVINAVQEKDLAKIAEVAPIFQKQFSQEKGFEFLKRPGARFAEDLTREEVLKAIQAYLGADAADKVAAHIGKDVADATDRELRSYLGDLKLSEDIVKLVGHKIGIGQVTENMNRIARAAEVVVGMGGGVGGGGFPPVGGFLERWQPGRALGADPAREFQFRLNEFLRFGINAAFKTKHGGGSIYQDLVDYLTTLGGGKQLRKEIEGGKGPFSDLGAVNEEIQNTIKDRLRQFNLDELKDEARKLGVEIGDTREQVVKSIVEKIDLPGFVEELHNVLRDAAVEAEKAAIIRDIRSGELSIEGTPDIANLARRRIEEKETDAGLKVNVREDITDLLQPLYQLRTSMANVDDIFKQFGDVYEQNIPAWAKATEDITERMKKVQVTADHMTQSMQDTTTGLTASGDAVTAMLQLFAAQTLNIIKAQKAFAEQLKLPTRPAEEEIDPAMVLNKLLKSKGLTDILGTTTPYEIKDVMAEQLEKLGISDIPAELKDAIRENVIEVAHKAAEAGEEVTKEQMDMIATIKIAEAQMKRIVDELQTVSFKEAVLREQLPGTEAFAGAPVPRAKRGLEYFIGPEVPGGAPPQDPAELRRQLEKEIEAQKAIRDAANAASATVEEKTPEVTKSWRELKDTADVSMQNLADAPQKIKEKLTNFKEILEKDFYDWAEETDKEIESERREADARLKKSMFDPMSGRLYDPEDVELMSPDERRKLTKAVSEAFSSVSSDTSMAVEESAKETADAVRDAAKEGLKSWTSRVRSAAQAAGAGGAAGGGGGDDDDFLKRLEKLRRMISEALSLKTMEDKIKRLEEISNALGQLQEDVTASDPANKILESIREAQNMVSTLRSFADPESIVRAVKEAERIQEPVPTEDIISNLRLLQNLAERTHNLYTDIWSAPEYVKEILDKIKTKGARAQFVEEFRKALQDANITGLAETEAWKRYHLAKVEYHLRSAEQFKKMAVEAENLADTRQYAERAGAAAAQAQRNIIRSFRGTTSPYLTTQPGARAGVRGRPINEELFQAAGVALDPRVVRAMTSEYSKLKDELRPILDMLTEIDLDKLVGPLTKARQAFAALTKQAAGAGRGIMGAFDFSSLTEDITTLRGQLEEFLFMNVHATEVQRQNIRDTIFYLKDLEKQYSRLGAEVVQGGILKVPKWLQPDVQRKLHQRNLELIKKGLSEAVSDKGPEALEKIGSRLNYVYKIFDEGGNVIDHFVFRFKKLGDAFTSAGQPIGRFSVELDDMLKNFQARRGLGQAFRRVIAWGAAAGVVYGTVNALRDMVNTIADVEMGMIQLRKVMNPVTTDFEEMQKQAVQFAKEFGTPIQQVIASMKVFAQQGLNQVEVLDRARTSVLAGNVTLLEAADATEALTSATKQFSDEGRGSIRFLDSWIEVAARHAITSKDLALALQRAGAAAKNAGIDFNQLNAIVTAIGAISRQTGRELGTSIRFIARRLTAQKAPQELAKVGVEAFLPTGDIRPAFEIMDDLAKKWMTLTDAQKLNIAQAIGGRRHYNSILILMQNWQEALTALSHSQNSQGSAMKRNQIVMESFRKQMEQLNQAVVETQLAFGKLALGPAKTLIQTFKWIIERISEIPTPIKVATVALGAMLVAAHKGAAVVDRFADAWSKLTGLGRVGIGGGLASGAKDILGAFKGITAAGDITDVGSALGKLGYITLEVGRSFNAFIGNVAAGATKFLIFKAAVLAVLAATTPLGGVIGKMLDSFGGLGKFFQLGLIPIVWTLSKVFANLSQSGTGIIGSLGPMIASFVLLKKTIGPVIGDFIAANKTAHDFAESQRDTVLSLQETVKTVGSISDSLDRLAERQAQVAKGEITLTPGTVTADLTKARRDLADVIADVLPSAIKGFDEWGNAIIRSDEALQTQADTLRKVAQEAENLINVDIARRWAADLEIADEEAEKFRLGLKNLASAIPIFGESLAKTIRVSPILELEKVQNELQNILNARLETPLTTVYEKPYKDLLKRQRELRTEVEKSVTGLKESIAAIPRGKNLEEFLGYVSKYQDQLEVLARYARAQTGLESIDWHDILAVEVFKRLGIDISESSDLTKDALEKAGFKLKKAVGDLADEYGLSIEELKKRAEEGKADARQFQFRPGDILLFSEEDAGRLKIAAQAALLGVEDTIEGQSKFVIKVLDEATDSWKSLDFTEDIRNLVTNVFSPEAFREYTEESVLAVNKILAGAAANINYPLPLELGPRFFAQVPTEQLLATGFGRQFGTGAGQTVFGSPEYKAAFEEDYKRFVDSSREYRNELEKIEKINQDKLDTETEIAPVLAARFKELQQIIMNDTAVFQFKAAMEELAKSFEEADRALKSNIKSEKIRRDLLVRTGGILAGQPKEIPTIQQQPLTIEDASIDELAYATNRRFRELVDSYSENSKRLDDIVSRIQQLIKTSDELKYMKDLYESNKALISKDQFQDYVETFKAVGDRNQALMITHLKDIAENTGDLVGLEKQRSGLAAERRGFTVNDRLEKKIEELGGYFGVATAQAASELESIGLGETAADFETSTLLINESAELFNYAVEKLTQLPLTELIKEYKGALGKFEEATSVGNLGFPGRGPAAIEKLFGTALGLKLGPAGYGKGLQNLVGVVEAERKRIGIKNVEELTLTEIAKRPEATFEDIAKEFENAGKITKTQLDDILNANVESRVSIDSLISQLSTVVLAIGARKGSRLAGTGLGLLAGAEVGNQLNLGRIFPGIVGAFLGKQFADFNRDINKQREAIAQAAEKGAGKEIFAAALARPQGQEVEGIDSLVTESSTQTDILKSMNQFLAKIAGEDVPKDLKGVFEDAERMRQKYAARRDIFSLLRSPIAFAGVTALAGIVGNVVERNRLPGKRTEAAEEERNATLQYFTENVQALANVAERTKGSFEDLTAKFLESIPEEERLTITPAMDRLNTFIETIASELNIKQEEALQLINKMTFDDLVAAVLRFQTKTAQELTSLANNLKISNLSKNITRTYEAELTGFLKGFRFPGAIEPGKPAAQAAPEERVFAAMPDVYESFIQGQEQLQMLSQRLSEITAEMAKLETTIDMGKDTSGQATRAFQALSDQQQIVKSSADQLKDSLGRMKETLDQAILVERLRVSIQDALYGLKKFDDTLKDINTTSIEMARREHPLAEVAPQWEDRNFWKRGMDQFELEMARIRKEKGFLPFDDSKRIKWQKEESLIQYNRGKELEKFNQEVDTAKSIYAELYDYQKKWGLDVKDLMSSLADDLERAGEVTYRGGRAEFRGVPALDTLQDKLAELAKEARDRQFKEQHDVLMLPTETILASIDQKIGQMVQTQSRMTSYMSEVPQQTKSLDEIQGTIMEYGTGTLGLDAGSVTTAIKEGAAGAFQERQAGGRIKGAGGPKTDSIPAFLSNGEFVINARSAERLGVPFLEKMNKTGKVPRFAGGGFVSDILANFPYQHEVTEASDPLKDIDMSLAQIEDLEKQWEKENQTWASEKLKFEYKPTGIEKVQQWVEEKIVNKYKSFLGAMDIGEEQIKQDILDKAQRGEPRYGKLLQLYAHKVTRAAAGVPQLFTEAPLALGTGLAGVGVGTFGSVESQKRFENVYGYDPNVSKAIGYLAQPDVWKDAKADLKKAAMVPGKYFSDIKSGFLAGTPEQKALAETKLVDTASFLTEFLVADKILRSLHKGAGFGKAELPVSPLAEPGQLSIGAATRDFYKAKKIGLIKSVYGENFTKFVSGLDESLWTAPVASETDFLVEVGRRASLEGAVIPAQAYKGMPKAAADFLKSLTSGWAAKTAIPTSETLGTEALSAIGRKGLLRRILGKSGRLAGRAAIGATKFFGYNVPKELIKTGISAARFLGPRGAKALGNILELYGVDYPAWSKAFGDLAGEVLGKSRDTLFPIAGDVVEAIKSGYARATGVARGTVNQADFATRIGQRVVQARNLYDDVAAGVGRIRTRAGAMAQVKPFETTFGDLKAGVFDLKDRMFREFENITDIFSPKDTAAKKLNRISKQIFAIDDEFAAATDAGDMVSSFDRATRKRQTLFESLETLKKREGISPSREKYIERLQKHMTAQQELGENSLKNIIAQSGTPKLNKMVELLSGIEDVPEFNFDKYGGNVSRYANDIKDIVAKNRSKISEARRIEKGLDLYEQSSERYSNVRNLFADNEKLIVRSERLGANYVDELENWRQWKKQIRTTEADPRYPKLSALDPNSPTFAEDVKKFYNRRGKEITTDWSDDAIKSIQDYFPGLKLKPGLNRIDMGQGVQLHIYASPEGAIDAAVYGGKLGDKFYVEYAVHKGGASAAGGAAGLGAGQEEGAQALFKVLREILKDAAVKGLELRPGEGGTISLGALRRLAVQLGRDAGYSKEQMSGLIKQLRTIEPRYQEGGHIRGAGGPTTDSIPAWLSDGEFVMKAASVKKLGTGMLDYMNKYGEVPRMALGGAPPVAVAAGPSRAEQRGISKRSFRDYEKMYRSYEKEHRGFDPKQYIKSWAVEEAPADVKQWILKKLSSESGLYIKGLTKVLNAIFRSGRAPNVGAFPGFPYQEGGPVKYVGSAAESAFRTGHGQLSLYDIYDPDMVAKLQSKNPSLAERLAAATAQRTPGKIDTRQLEIIMELFESEGPEYAARALRNLLGIPNFSFGMGGLAKLRYQDGGKPDTRAADWLRNLLAGKTKITALPKENYGDFMDALDSGDVSAYAKYTSNQDLLNAIIGAYEQGAFNPDQITAARGTFGQSVTELRRALGFAFGGLLNSKRYKMGGLMKPYQDGGAVPEADIGPGAGEAFLSVVTSIAGAVPAGWAMIAKLITGDLDSAVKSGAEISDFFTYRPRTKEGEELLKTISPALQLPGRVADAIASEAFYGKHPYYTAEDPGVPYKGDLMDQLFKNHPDARAFLATMTKVGIEWETYARTGKAAGKLFKETPGAAPGTQALFAEEGPGIYDLGDLDVGPDALKAALNDALESTDPFAAFKERIGLGEDVTKDYIFSDPRVGEAIRDVILNKGLDIAEAVEKGFIPKDLASKAVAREFPMSVDPDTAIYGDLLNRLNETIGDKTKPFEQRLQAQQTLKKLIDKIGETKARTLDEVWEKQLKYIRSDAPQHATGMAAFPIRALEKLIVEPGLEFTGYKTPQGYTKPGGVALTGTGKAAVATLEPTFFKILKPAEIAPDLPLDLDIFGMADLMSKPDASMADLAKLEKMMEPLFETMLESKPTYLLRHEAGVHARGQTAAMIEQLGVKKFGQYVEQYLDPRFSPEEIYARLEERLTIPKDITAGGGSPEVVLTKVQGIVENIKTSRETITNFQNQIERLSKLDSPAAKGQIDNLNNKITTYQKDVANKMIELQRTAEEANAIIQEYATTEPGVYQAARGTGLAKGGFVSNMLSYGMGGLAKMLNYGMGGAYKIPSYQGGGVVPEDQLAFLHKGEEVRTPEQARASNSLNLDLGSIQRAVEDGITNAMSKAEVKLDTTEITVNVKSTATAGADIEAFMENNNTRVSTLEGETKTFARTLKTHDDQITALNNDLDSLDIENAAELWDSVETLRTDVRNIEADFTGRFTSFDSQITSLRRDLTQNYTDHREILSTANTARMTAEKAMSRSMSST